MSIQFLDASGQGVSEMNLAMVIDSSDGFNYRWYLACQDQIECCNSMT